MNKSMILAILGLGGAYFFLSTRTPVWVLGPAGTYVPSGMLDQLTVMLTGAVPPQTKTQSTISAVTSGLVALTQAIGSPPAMASVGATPSGAVTTPGYSGFGHYEMGPGVVPRIFSAQRR